MICYHQYSITMYIIIAECTIKLNYKSTGMHMCIRKLYILCIPIGYAWFDVSSMIPKVLLKHVVYGGPVISLGLAYALMHLASYKRYVLIHLNFLFISHTKLKHLQIRSISGNMYI